jgi:hypothetical protein
VNKHFINTSIGTLFVSNIIGFSSIALADTCKITDPTRTPLNIRERPNGEIIGTIRNGKTISILKFALDENGKPWAKIQDKSGRIGWVIREFISCY